MIVTRTGPDSLEIKAPAKLNLFLEVLGKRPDGFHELETVMHSIDLYDGIRIGLGRKNESREEGVAFSCSGISVGPDEDNLALRAARLFFREFARSPAGAPGSPRSASIHLDKTIPAGAGLGGGSSDAAAVLIGLNELSGRPFDRAALVAMGNRLGSDIAFFFFCGTALCTGRGEIVEPLAGTESLRFVLIFPGIPCCTREVYQNLKLGLTKGKKDITIFFDTLKRRHTDTTDAICNRLQEAAFRTAPPLREIWRMLQHNGFGRFTLTGSGSGMFRILDETESVPDFRDIDQGICPWKVYVVRSSPANSPTQ
jgi:4-diphosphocytidyl-2-C-methyl-D-erythritol kinase